MSLKNEKRKGKKYKDNNWPRGWLGKWELKISH